VDLFRLSVWLVVVLASVGAWVSIFAGLRSLSSWLGS
jgi:hypothetical protein